VVAKLATKMAAIVGDKGAKGADYVPYFEPYVEPPKPSGKPRRQLPIPGQNQSIAAAIAWLRANPDVSRPKPRKDGIGTK
jgi:hypothetical protein